MKIYKTFTEKFIEEQSKNKKLTKSDLINWTWLERENLKKHLGKNNDKTKYQPYNKYISNSRRTLIIVSSEIYFTLFIEPFQCCILAGICPIDEDKDKKENNFLGELN